MGRRKNKKSDKITTVEQFDTNPTVQNKLVTNFNIELLPLILDRENEIFENLHLLDKLLPILEETSHVFGDDSAPKIDDYKNWLQYHLGFIEQLAPWIFAVVSDGEPVGFCWATNWAGNGLNVHSVQISGAAKRKIPVAVTTQSIRKLVEMIFNQTSAYIVRGGYTEDNLAAGFALGRAGFSHPEKERATMIRGGHEITGIIKSITRPEWEAGTNV